MLIMKKKSIDGSYLNKLNADYVCETKYFSDTICGYASLVTVKQIPQKFTVVSDFGELCLADTGYSWLTFLPENENWCITGFYNQNRNIIEWYFDITKANYIDENGIPSYDDLFLDIVIFPDGYQLLLDEDELSDALNNHVITIDDYNLAYRVCHELTERNILDLQFVSTLCDKLFSLFA